MKIARVGFTLLLAASAARAAGTALVGATLHPVSGPPVVGTMVIENGKISALAPGAAPPPGATTVDLTGKHVYPGFLHVAGPLGIIEIDSVRGTVDTTEVGDNNAALRAEVAFNGESQLLMPAIAGGVLSAHAVHAGGIVSGTSAVMNLRGWNWRDMTLRAPVGMHLTYPRLTRSRFGSQSDEDFEKDKEKALKKLDDLFDAAAAYHRARTAQSEGKGPAVDAEANFEALRPVLEGKLPLYIHAADKLQIDSALDWAKKRGLANLVLVSGADAAYAAQRLATERVPVILDGVLTVPRREWEPYDAAYGAAAALHAAGVRFAIGDGGDAANARNLPFHAAMAAAFGLDKEAALRSVTLSPAEILGVADRLGSLEPGKNATFFVSDGDPLEIRTRIERVWIDGEEIDLAANRQFQLYRKYQERPRPSGAVR